MSFIVSASIFIDKKTSFPWLILKVSPLGYLLIFIRKVRIRIQIHRAEFSESSNRNILFFQLIFVNQQRRSTLQLFKWSHFQLSSFCFPLQAPLTNVGICIYVYLYVVTKKNEKKEEKVNRWKICIIIYKCKVVVI